MLDRGRQEIGRTINERVIRPLESAQDQTSHISGVVGTKRRWAHRKVVASSPAILNTAKLPSRLLWRLFKPRVLQTLYIINACELRCSSAKPVSDSDQC